MSMIKKFEGRGFRFKILLGGALYPVDWYCAHIFCISFSNSKLYLADSKMKTRIRVHFTKI